MIVISLVFDRLWSWSRVNDLIAITSWSRQALSVMLFKWDMAVSLTGKYVHDVIQVRHDCVSLAGKYVHDVIEVRHDCVSLAGQCVRNVIQARHIYFSAGWPLAWKSGKPGNVMELTKSRIMTRQCRKNLLQPFYGPFSGTTQVSWCQKRTSELHGARED